MHKQISLTIIAVLLFHGRSLCYAQQAPVMSLAEAPQAVSNPFIPKLPIKEKEEKKPVEKNQGTTEEQEQQQFPPSPAQQPEEPEEEEVDLGTPTLNITGVIWNSDRPQAIVNGNVIEIGDRMFSVPSDKGSLIPEIKIVNIDKEGLSVAYDGKTVVIKPQTETEKEQK